MKEITRIPEHSVIVGRDFPTIPNLSDDEHAELRRLRTEFEDEGSADGFCLVPVDFGLVGSAQCDVFEWQRGQRSVAVKMYPRKADCRRVLKILRHVREHPHIPKVLATSERLPVAVTELYHSSVYRAFASGAITDWKTKIKILFDTAQGMAHLHTFRIVHRDLKWSNVMLSHSLDDPKCRCVIIDFGLSWRQGTPVPVQRPTVIGGTAWYTAPEILNLRIPEVQRFTCAADVFAFGIMMYELVAETTTPFGPHFPQGDDFASAVRASDLILKGTRPDTKNNPKILALLADDSKKWVVEMMRACWAARRVLRYTFSQIAETIRTKECL